MVFLILDRHVFFYVLDSNPLGSATFDPLLIRWSSQESVLDWTPTANKHGRGI